MRSAMIVIMILGLVVNVSATGVSETDKPFTGVFEGNGRACYGKLFIRTKTIEWHTPFSVCKRTPYEILKKELDAEKPVIVFLLKKKSDVKCDFGVITLDWNPEFPDYWNATGYRSLEDYEKDSDDTLRCSLDKLGK